MMTCEATAALAHVRGQAGVGRVPDGATVAVHFHPDAPTDGGTVIEAIASSGCYLSQFSTGTSNGGLTARLGGDRWAWESRMFGGAYDGADPTFRPRYGALQVGDDSYGPAPRFGSAFLVLKPEVLERSTFCYPDSAHLPLDIATAERFPLERLLKETPQSDPLDRYIEAHIHGGLTTEDVDVVVLDPSYRNSPVGDAAQSLGCAVGWHDGFRLDPGAPDSRYRGQRIAELVRTIAAGQVLTPARFGEWAGRANVSPREWRHAWHVLARFGRVWPDVRL